MKGYAEMLRNRMKEGIVFVTNTSEDKVTFVCAASKTMIDKGLKAGDLVRLAAEKTDGKGGGRPDMAQAGGRNLSKIPDAIEAVREKIRQC